MTGISRRRLGTQLLGPVLLGAAWTHVSQSRSGIARAQEFTPRALGAFVPGAPHDPGALDRFRDMIYRPPTVVMWFDAWGSSAAVTRNTVNLDLIYAVAERGAVPMITWEPWDPFAGVDQPAYRLASIAQGDFDAYINAWAYRLAAYGGPVLIRFAHEMNAPWYPWGIRVDYNTAEEYIGAWRHIRALFDAAGAYNVRWVWCVDAGSRHHTNIAAAYPGDDVVDWVALDGYNWGTSLPDSYWRPMRDVFGEAYNQLTTMTGRPLMISEIGCADQGGDKAEWIRTALSEVPTLFPRIMALCWFNEAGDVADWRVESSTWSLDAFRAEVARPEWQGTAASVTEHS
jgi:hypothetical protein